MANAGDLVSTTTQFVNANTGAATAFDATNTFTPTMKEFYDTLLLDNIREKVVYAQLGRKQALPSKHGRIVEWRKFNTLPDADELVEGVIPTGKKFGMSSITVKLVQHGLYVAISDLLDMHAIDPVIVGATEEIGASLTRTYDKLVRNALMTGSHIIYADALNKTADYAYVSTPTSRTELSAEPATFCGLSPDMIAKAVTRLEQVNAPYYDGNNYVAIAHPSIIYDLRRHPEWIDSVKYTDAAQQLFNGEMGMLNGVRFIKSTLAPVVGEAGAAGASGTKAAVYQTMFFGKDAFAVVDPEGAQIETIFKSRDQIGGPLNQYSTVGGKFETAAKLIYPERMVIVESCSSYSYTDKDNIALKIA